MELRWGPRGTALVLLAVVAAAAASVIVAMSSTTVTRFDGRASSDGPTAAGPGRSTTTERVIDDPSTGVLLFLGAPVLVAALPLAFRSRRTRTLARAGAAAVLFGWVLLLAFGGCELYLAAVGLMVAAAAVGARPAHAAGGGTSG